MKFIKTYDENVAANLKAAHFTLMNQDTEGMHVFLNDGRFEFDEMDQKKIVYTNSISL